MNRALSRLFCAMLLLCAGAARSATFTDDGLMLLGVSNWAPGGGVAWNPVGVSMVWSSLLRSSPMLTASNATTPLGITPTATAAAGAGNTITLNGATCAGSGIVAGWKVYNTNVNPSTAYNRLNSLIGTVASCSDSPTPGVVTLTGNNLIAYASTDTIAVQSTLAESCTGTFAWRARANYSPTGTYNSNQNGEAGFMTAWGTNSTAGLGETQYGLWFATDQGGATTNYRINPNKFTSIGTSGSGFNGVNGFKLQPAPWAASYSDVWVHAVMSWNSCGATAWFAGYWAPEGGAWSLMAEGSSAGPFNIAYDNDILGPSNTQTIFGPDYADQEDIILDLAPATPIVTTNATACATAPGWTSGHSCIPLGTLNGYYNGSVAVRQNASGNCSDWLGHQPTVCFTTDGSGSYAASPSNFSTNRGYGGAFQSPALVSMAGGTNTTQNANVFGLSSFPVNYQTGRVAQKWAFTINGLPATVAYPALTAPLDVHRLALNDMLLVVATQDVGSPDTVTCNTAGGWTSIFSGPSINGSTASTAFYSAVCYKFVTSGMVSAGQDTTAAFVFSNTAVNAVVTLSDYVNVDSSNPIDAYTAASTVSATSSPASANLYSYYPNSLYVGILAGSYASNFSANAPANTSYKLAGSRNSAGSITIVDALLPQSGTTAFGAWTPNQSLVFQSIGIAFKASGSVGSPSAHGATPALQGAVGSFHVPANATVTNASCWGAGAAGTGGSGLTTSGGGGGFAGSGSAFSGGSDMTDSSGVVYFQASFAQPATQGAATQWGGSSWVNVGGANAAPSVAANGCSAANALAAASTAQPAGCATGNAALCVGSLINAGGAGKHLVPINGGGGGAGSGVGGAGVAATGLPGGAGGSPDGGAGGTAISGQNTTPYPGFAPGGGGTNVYGSGAWGGVGGAGQVKVVF